MATASIWDPATPIGGEASSVGFNPTATLSSTNVQAAIEEADTENRALSAAALQAANNVSFDLARRKAVFATGVAATDDANIQAAIDSLPVGGVLDLFGIFSSSAAKNLKPQIMLRNGGGAKLNHSNSATNCFQYIVGSGLGFPGQITIEGLEIFGPGVVVGGEPIGTLTWSTVKAAIFIDANCPFVRIRDCDIRSFFAGAVLRNTYCSEIGGAFFQNRHGIMLYGECHNTVLDNPFVDGLGGAPGSQPVNRFLTGLSVNYGSPAEAALVQSICTRGGAYQGYDVGIWVEKSQGFCNAGRIYFETNRKADMVIGVNDGGGYARGANFTKIQGANIASNCEAATALPLRVGTAGCNIQVAHSVGVEMSGLGHFPGSGAPTDRPILYVDGFCGVAKFAWDSLVGTNLFSFGEPQRVVIEVPGGRTISPINHEAADQFGSPLAPFSRGSAAVLGESGRPMLELGRPIQNNTDIYVSADDALGDTRVGFGCWVSGVYERWLSLNPFSKTIEFTRALQSASARATTGQIAAMPTIASSATIAPAQVISFVSGTAAVVNITVPVGFPNGGRLTLIPTAAWTTTAAGNIHRAITTVVGQPVDFIWDGSGSKWYVKD